MVDNPIQEYCFLELERPSVFDGIEECVKKGATKIAVVPVLLLTANHAKKDIPLLLEQAKTKHGDIKMNYGDPIGVHKKMIDVLVERVLEKYELTNEMEILLVGRGSSDRAAVEDTEQITHLLSDKLNVTSVNNCFLAAAQPKFEGLLEHRVAAGAKKIVVLPYLLFTGVLIKEIHRFVNQLTLSPEQELIVCDHLGDHPNVCLLLKDRVVEAIGKEEAHAKMA